MTIDDFETEFRARWGVVRCGYCNRPLETFINAAGCDCGSTPAKDEAEPATKDVLGMSAAMDTFQQACAAAVPVMQWAVRSAFGADTDPPPSGWRSRPPLL